MARKEKKYHYIYKTTNIITNKYYYGMHSTDNLDDGYVGSGKRLWYSINKYCKKNHKVNIIEFYPTRKILKEEEEKLINENTLNNPMCMNLKLGGEGGFPLNFDEETFHKKGGKVGGNIHAIRLKEDACYAKKHKENWCEMIKKVRLIKRCGCDWSKRKHTDEEKRKIGNASSKHQKGCGNSQYGTCWITNGVENKKIKKDEQIPDGWKSGRKMK